MAAPHAVIPRSLYKQIASRLPILCVDLLIWRDRKLLLVKRKNHPLKGQWWVVGGRILLGEDPVEAAHRKAREEAGIQISDLRFRGYYSDIYQQNAFEKTPCQTVSMVFLCATNAVTVKLDSQSAAYKWAAAIPERFARHLRY